MRIHIGQSYRTILSSRKYLYCARYPEYDDSRMVNAQDIEKCRNSLVTARNLALDFIKQHDIQISEEIDDIER